MGEREIKVGQVWRNCIAEVEVTFRDVSYYYPKIRTTFSGGLTDEMDERVFRATHEFVRDPKPEIKVGDWVKNSRTVDDAGEVHTNALPELLDEVDRLEAETAALKARVAALEEAGKQLRAAMIRPIADVVLIEKFKAAEEKWAAALRAALDRAGEP